MNVNQMLHMQWDIGLGEWNMKCSKVKLEERTQSYNS